MNLSFLSILVGVSVMLVIKHLSPMFTLFFGI